jgi:predicted acyl esterase
MKRPIRHRLTLLLALLFCAACAGAADNPPPKYPSLPSETPAHFTPDHSSFGYVIRDVMIPMRDGVKLHTVIMLRRGAHDAPMLLTRTPYDARSMVRQTEHDQLSGNMATALQSHDGFDNAVPVIVDGGYIRVIQDVRGKYGSEGDFVMNPMRDGVKFHTEIMLP